MERYDHNTAAFELIRRLRAEGFYAWAWAHDSTICGGATGTEIALGLRWDLKKMKRETKGLSKETLALVKELLSNLPR